jgi:hypothetical protein
MNDYYGRLKIRNICLDMAALHNSAPFTTSARPPINPDVGPEMQNKAPALPNPPSTELHIVTAVGQAGSIISGYLTAKLD